MKNLLSKQKLICYIDENLEIWADAHQYILRRDKNPNRDSYYSDLKMVIQDIFDLKIKEFAIEKQNKSLESLGESIKEARRYIDDVIQPILKGYNQ